jgi:hypothetical protein
LLCKLKGNANDLKSFVSKHRYIKGIDYTTALGPGSYEIVRDFDSSSMLNNSSMVKAERFSEKADHSKPGPGEYSVEGSRKWNKKSFNILFA